MSWRYNENQVQLAQLQKTGSIKSKMSFTAIELCAGGGGQALGLEMAGLDKSKGGKDEPSNLRAVCANCNEGLQNAAPQKPDRIQLLSQIRRATIDDQQAVLDWLQKKFSTK
jgi:hypothetical protein